MVSLPTGTVTFLFTDIEGSTRLLQEIGPDYGTVLDDHSRIIRGAIAGHSGMVVSTEGDSFFAVFTSPEDAVAAAVELQRKLEAHEWPSGARIRVRTGIHTGEGAIGGDNYVGIDVHRAARIAAAGHGGQVLLSDSTAVLAQDHLPGGVSLRSMGSHRLKDLARTEGLHQLVIDGLVSEFPPLKTLEFVPNNLPVEMTSFVGRGEMAGVLSQLETARIVTLTGPGGTGKTRLSLQVAAELTGQFADGVWFVPLAAIREPDLVTSAVATTLGLQPSADDPDARLADYLRTKHLLLVLDNFEQVIDGAPKISRWLQGAPGLRVLVTSRGPLRISGEREFPVPPLALPSEHELLTPETLMRFEAVALFVDRARGARPDFTLDARTAPVVAEIVAKLDGLPLAIELAAARIRLLSLEGIRDRLGSRLGLLTGGARDLPERQRTLRSAIEWSYDLLDEEHRRLFARLGVFVGGFAIERAGDVCGPGLGIDILDGISALGDQGLLRRIESVDQSRFLMLETIREFAVECLAAGGEDVEVRGRHARVYLGFAEAAAPMFTRRAVRSWLDLSETDHDNLRAAFAWAVERQDGDLAQRLSGALWRFWQMRGHLREGREKVEIALKVPGGTPSSELAAREAAGGLAYWQADMEAAEAHYLVAVDLARQTGDPALIANAIYNVSSPRAVHMGVDEVLAMLDHGLELAESLGDRALIGRLHWGRGTVHYLSERPEIESPEAALVEFRLAAEYLAGSEEIFDIGWTERMLASVLLGLGRADEAEIHLRRGLEMFVEAGDLSALPLHVADFVQLALARGQFDRAIVLAGAASALQTYSETRLLDLVANDVKGLDRAIEGVGRERAEKLASEGQALNVDQILERIGSDE
ncbi:MAG TPA: adenylate/guanylate cyclase domain-containing protein [Acidimicrobiia bacterium]|nr:adenylate/guanylate cyclase domain-containing protein [Acidimicrobiia bacterium]